MLQRMKGRAPHMGGPARAAALAWFCVMAGRVAGRGGPANWSKDQRADYLKKISIVAKAIVERGTEVEMSEVIECLARRLRKIIRSF